MGCRCNERRDAIRAGVKAAASGDLKKLAEQAQVFTKTVRDDASDFRGKIASARQTLARR